MAPRLAVVLVAALVALGAASPLSAQTRPSAGAAAAFLSVIDDVPLMAGLAERRERALVFDKPEGRIVETVAEGRLTRAQVLNFYAATLPQLGWAVRGDGRFLREGEELALSFAAGPSGTLSVRFALSPDR